MATTTNVSDSNNAFSMDLFKNLTEHDKTGNVFYSPLSIFSAMGMVLLGAKANTASQITEVLRLKKPDQPNSEEEQSQQQQQDSEEQQQQDSEEQQQQESEEQQQESEEQQQSEQQQESGEQKQEWLQLQLERRQQKQMERRQQQPSLIRQQIEARMQMKTQIQQRSRLPAYLTKCLKENGDVHEEIKQLLSEINKQNTPYELNVANRLYGDQSFIFIMSFIGDTKNYYTAPLETVNFKNSEEAAIKINSWVEEKTKEKIKDLLSKDMLSEMTKLVLVNAIYFKGKWDSPFNKEDTQDAPFKLNKNESKNVKMMFQKSKFRFASISEVNCQILEMPYETEDLSMLIFLPKDIEDETTGLEKLERELTYDRFVEWTSRVREVEVEVKLPQFKLEESYSLNKILIGLGMADAFDPSKCDFSGMSLSKNLAISNVVHKAFVEVNEEGTEAAGATGVIMELTSFQPTVTYTFFVDHPALFFIRHNSTNTILFAGRLASPE